MSCYKGTFKNGFDLESRSRYRAQPTDFWGVGVGRKRQNQKVTEKATKEHWYKLKL